MKIFIAAALLLTLSQACTTSQTSTDGTGEQPKQECEMREVSTGSRIAKKICVTKEQREQERRDAHEILERNQHNPTIKGN